MKQLSKEQLAFVESASKLLNSKARAILLKGGPGTGKSTAVTEAIIRHFDSIKILITAPTNKATLNLLHMMDDLDEDYVGVMTTHKSLKLKMNNDTETLIAGPYGETNERPIYNTDVCVIDEGSMVDKEIVGMLIDALMDNPKLKLIIVGDEDQLAPPNEETSKLMGMVDAEHTTDLTENFRFPNGSDIDTNVQAIKTALRDKTYDFIPTYSEKFHRGCSLKIKNIHTFIQNQPNFFDNSENRILCWRRATFKAYNKAIRKMKLGDIADKHKLIKNERFISYTTNHDVGIFIGDEGEVHSFKYVDFNTVCYDKIGIKIPSINMILKLDNGSFANVCTLNPKSQSVYDSYEAQYKQAAIEASANQRRHLWAKYWNFVSSFHQIEPAYAQTIHSSQGSTFNAVVIDNNDIEACWDLDTQYRLKYVAWSRAKYATIS